MNTRILSTGVMARNILIIEDSKDIADLVAFHLADLDCDVTTASDGIAGFEKASSGKFDLIILDLMLPGMDGLEICRKIRSQADYTPILMVTAKTAEMDRVAGLEMGADDYISKPFSITELMARVKAIFRRMEAFVSAPKTEEERIEVGGMVIDRSKRKITLDGVAVDLTAKEFDLLLHFASHPGAVYTRAQLLDAVWGYGHEGYEHTVNSHINRLRAKIEKNPSEPRFIHTVWGVGYKFNDQL